jgi:hypothetical protein
MISAVLAGPALAAPATPLAPSSKWQMDYAPTECRLLRSFGTGAQTVTVQIGQVVPAPPIELVLVGPRIPVTDAFAPAGLSTSTVGDISATAQGFAAEGRFLSSLRIDPNPSLRDALVGDIAGGKPTRLGVTFARGYSTTLDLGQMKAPLAALDACMDDLVRTWGVDPVEQRARKTGPVPANDPGTWFRVGDYPLEQRRAAAGALVILRLGVGANGAVTGCAVAKAGGDKAFEDLTCRLATERARFTPALGASGRPIASYWAQRIRWQPGTPFLRSM